jgi:hypothetical protein
MAELNQVNQGKVICWDLYVDSSTPTFPLSRVQAMTEQSSNVKATASCLLKPHASSSPSKARSRIFQSPLTLTSGLTYHDGNG